mmetsp:Transcript_108730/g.335869  ORF Transcript_108730/g.335869 Transcript_108730/m.335869 type:complete len:398 (+) Transcript_108730:26-1219(+)
MIRYRRGYNGVFLLFRVVGTAWPHGIVPGLLSAALGLILGLLEVIEIKVTDDTVFLQNPYPYQLFAFVVGFILVFRTNFGYSRYMEAIDAVQRMGSKWLDGACMAIAFDAKADESGRFLQPSIVAANSCVLSMDDAKKPYQGPDHPHFFEELVHLFSLMHALALQHLRWDSDLESLSCAPVPRSVDLGEQPIRSTSARNRLSHLGAKEQSRRNWSLELPVLGGISEEEVSVLEADSDGQRLSSLARCAMVESWIMRRVTTRQKHETAGDMRNTDAPILSRMVQVVSDGHLAFSQAAKVADTPFPFPYQNIISTFLWMFATTLPVMVNANLMTIPARFVITFIAVWAYFSLAEVGDNLEDPYVPYDPNDLPLEAIHHSFNARLLAFGVVPTSERLLQS